ncbi:enoyl-CoA hydratase-related protein [Siminovitchia sp. FSL H7-0308]|uniref:Enoyl-CoA hydratase n=1 Tax=Siminovitchia thermophila TaxID=1245522 RepID=A0ABS2R649_9BACI|nr:enoyl-CoA hydratase-related protein [Siminovitchia thermophila]MBM7715135.1 enoyl-CoA hydratase [Siminovitchia thermophila]ONK22791.1 enoyl-CoA hydratase [Bacillus sp. VT-16-64]
MSNYQHILTEEVGPVGVVWLNRPNVLNALNRVMVREILEALERFDRKERIRVILLAGKGKAFAAGADIDEMAEENTISMELLNQFADWDRLAQIKTPIIGSVHGYCLGGGFELALLCDMMYAASDAKFGFPEVNLAVMPGAGGTQRLTKLLGKTRALEWIWSGDMMSAEEALSFGVVNKLYPADTVFEETLNFAKKLAEKPPLAVRMIKEAVHKAVDYPLQEGMYFERKNFYLLFSSQDQKEGMKAFMEKRKPDFKGY